jgi:hypothetical protein
MIRFGFFTLALLLCGPVPALAAVDGFHLEPGKWEVTTTRRMSMMPGDQIDTREQCITEANSDPSADMDPGGDCQVVDRTESANAVEWRVQCNLEGTPATGIGRMQSEGGTATGSMRIEMTVQGVAASFEMEWSGRRLGEC